MSATRLEGASTLVGRGQAPEYASSQLASQRSQTPSGAPPSGIKVVSTGVSKTVVPLTPLLPVRMGLARIWRHGTGTI